MDAVLETLFTTLFKYRPVVFEDGRFAFEAGRPFVVLTLGLALALVTVVIYLRQRPRVGNRLVAFFAALRLLAMALFVFVLLRPVLRISTAVPGENFLAVLIDDSRSMQLAGEGSASRGSQALGAFTAETSELRRRLEERFTLRYYRFSDTVTRMDPARPLAFEGRLSDLGSALEHVRTDLAGVPLAGAVLVTDGADNADARLTEPLLQLASRAVPVYTVGLGEERFRRDVELGRIEAPKRLLKGSAFTVDVMVEQEGFDGETLVLNVEENGALVATRDVTFGRGQGATSVRLNLQADDEGAMGYRFSIAGDERERITENNARDLLLQVEDRREKILYVEGEPRFEVKFLRQAVAEDKNVQVVVLQRTAEKKYLRLGVDDPLELLSGFPSTREELFAYRGLILGSVEAGFFSDNQLRIIEEFVSQRGGGLLLLGGRRSFAAGGYQGTPLESLSPIVLEDPSAGEGFLAEVTVRPTQPGLAHAVLQLGADPEASQERWQTLPPLTSRHPLYRTKPGASLLLTGSPAAIALDEDSQEIRADELAILASQRYGRGRVIAFTVQDSWLWQMHADIPLEDMTHERLWRQMLRWLVSTVPRQVALETSGSLVAPGEPVTLRAEVKDAAYLGLNGARVEATVIDPTGRVETVPLEWTVERDGEYEGTFVPGMLGPYEVSVSAEHAGQSVGSDEVRLLASESTAEYFGAEMNAPLLRRIAEETGGRFYTAENASDLAEDARFTKSGKTVVETCELWDMPVVLLLLLGWISAEWGLRRRRGLP